MLETTKMQFFKVHGYALKWEYLHFLPDTSSRGDSFPADDVVAAAVPSLLSNLFGSNCLGDLCNGSSKRPAEAASRDLSNL